MLVRILVWRIKEQKISLTLLKEETLSYQQDLLPHLPGGSRDLSPLMPSIRDLPSQHV